jgi:hypothetical protein
MPVIWFVILVALALVMVLTYPTWPYARRWGYAPSGSAFAAGIVILLLLWLGYLTVWWPWRGHWY